jgi:hypothetical protein
MMNVRELKQWLVNKKDDATVVVVAHNRDYEFTMSLGGGCDGGGDNNYDSIGFYVDELCQSEKEQNNE